MFSGSTLPPGSNPAGERDKGRTYSRSHDGRSFQLSPEFGGIKTMLPFFDRATGRNDFSQRRHKKVQRIVCVALANCQYLRAVSVQKPDAANKLEIIHINRHPLGAEKKTHIPAKFQHLGFALKTAFPPPYRTECKAERRSPGWAS